MAEPGVITQRAQAQGAGAEAQSPGEKRAVLVLGAECSGTRLVTQILMAAGCVGSADHYQWWDDHEFEDDDGLIVWRRSFPHGRDRGWPDLGPMVDRLEAAGYQVQAVVIVREHRAVTSSQVVKGYSEDAQHAWHQLREAYGRIFGGLWARGVPFVVQTYEGLVSRPVAVQAFLADLLELPEVPRVLITDASAKYYEGD